MKQHSSLILILTIMLSAFIAYGFLSLPTQKGIHEKGFSSARVIEDIKVIAEKPHSVAHPEERANVFNYLTERLEALGGNPQTYIYPNIKARRFTFDARNILAEFPPMKASKDTTYLMMVAHYDSNQPRILKKDTLVSMGAADDGYGLGVILETVHQALKYRKDWHQGIKVLFTDAEEVDLQGMKAAYKHNKEIFSNVGLLINVEARGPFGPALLFETSPGNDKLMDFYAEHANYPFTYSLTNLVYKYLPNGTDFTIIKDSIAGLNFSAIADINHYHTDLDNIHNISAKTIQHYGEQISSLTQAYLTDSQYADKQYFIGEEDNIYFTIPLLGMFNFSKNQYWLLNIGICFLLLNLMLKEKSIRWKSLFIHSGCIIAISLLLLIAGELIAWLSVHLSGLRFRKFSVITGVTYDNTVILFSIMLVAIALIRYFRNHHHTLLKLYSTMFTLLIGSLLCLGFLEENMVFFIPLCIGTITLTLWKATSSRIFPLLGMAILLLHTFSFIYVLAMALTIGSLGIYLFLAFYYFMVLIPLAYGYLADKASSQTP